jgi:hypothetical protein
MCLLAVTVTLSGCASLVKPRLPDVFKDPPPPSGSNGTYTLALYKDDFDAYNAKIPPLNPSPKPQDVTEATALRNKMVYGVLAEIDYVYHNYEMSLFMNEGSFRVATDILALGLGVASTITNGERAKTVLTAALTGFTGATLSIDKNFFRQQTVQALISSMQSGRDETKALILKRLSEPDTTYPFQAARSDMTAYFFAGTLPGALQHLNQTAAVNADSVHTDLKRIQLALTGISQTDVKNATDINKAIAAAFKSGDLSKVEAYLNAMGHQVPDTATPEAVTGALRALGDEIDNDPTQTLKDKRVTEARKAGLIQ